MIIQKNKADGWNWQTEGLEEEQRGDLWLKWCEWMSEIRCEVIWRVRWQPKNIIGLREFDAIPEQLLVPS